MYTDGTINSTNESLGSSMENFFFYRFLTSKQEVDDIVPSSNIYPNVLLEEETGYELYDTEDGKTVPTVETHVQLDEQESDDVANKIANKLFDPQVTTTLTLRLVFNAFLSQLKILNLYSKEYLVENKGIPSQRGGVQAEFVRVEAYPRQMEENLKHL